MPYFKPECTGYSSTNYGDLSGAALGVNVRWKLWAGKDIYFESPLLRAEYGLPWNTFPRGSFSRVPRRNSIIPCSTGAFLFVPVPLVFAPLALSVVPSSLAFYRIRPFISAGYVFLARIQPGSVYDGNTDSEGGEDLFQTRFGFLWESRGGMLVEVSMGYKRIFYEDFEDHQYGEMSLALGWGFF